MSEDTVTVYWSPESTWEVDQLGEWNMLYPEPTTLFSDLQKQKLATAGKDTYFSCPATSDKYKKTFVFRNTLPSDYDFDFTNENPEQNYFKHTSKNYLSYSILRPPTITAGPMVNFNLYYSFFSEEPLEAVFTPPMMHKPQYTMYGTSIPGQFDIGQWFRPFPLEVQMWNMKGEFHLKDEEPLFYLELKTTKKVELKRFKMTGEISSYLKHCSSSKSTWGYGVTLPKRYERFNQSRMNDMVLKAIKANLLD